MWNKKIFCRVRTPLFRFPEHLYYHRGHTWAQKDGDLFKVGMDEFAKKLLGKIDKIYLPAPGKRLKQGGTGWIVKVHSGLIKMISPVEGEVLSNNGKVLENPELLEEDCYEKGWLMVLKSETPERNVKQLLSGRLARIWQQESIETLMEMKENNYVFSLDGGNLLSGLAKTIDEERWQGIAKVFFLTE